MPEAPQRARAPRGTRRGHGARRGERQPHPRRAWGGPTPRVAGARSKRGVPRRACARGLTRPERPLRQLRAAHRARWPASSPPRYRDAARRGLVGRGPAGPLSPRSPCCPCCPRSRSSPRASTPTRSASGPATSGRSRRRLDGRPSGRGPCRPGGAPRAPWARRERRPTMSMLGYVVASDFRLSGRHAGLDAPALVPALDALGDAPRRRLALARRRASCWGGRQRVPRGRSPRPRCPPSSRTSCSCSSRDGCGGRAPATVARARARM